MGKKRLWKNNLSLEYPDLGSGNEVVIREKSGLLQKNYGLPLDCTLTCLAFMFGEQHYDTIENIAETLGYDGNKSGTYAFTIKAIMRRVMKSVGVSGVCKSAYCKGIGYTWKRIKGLIDNNHYIVLSMSDDGRGYYKSHSVTIIGYAEYRKHRFLVVYDNWNTTPSYIDYNKMCMIASINWYE